MKFRKLSATHFGCVDRAEMTFGPGLNVLFGPNDLGKSTLAASLRCALLLPHTSSASAPYVSWSRDELPEVTLDLHVAEQTLRVFKRFGRVGGSALLHEMVDESTWSVLAKSRSVDQKLRDAIGWGLPRAGGRGQKGLPESFLTTALLGEQADVERILRAALSDDKSDEVYSRLSEIVGGFAEDPRVRAVLDVVQKEVDRAFDKSGKRRRGRGSPFKDVAEKITRARDELAELTTRLRETEAVEEQSLSLARARDEIAAEVARLVDTLRDAEEASDARAAEKEKRATAQRLRSELTRLREDDARLEAAQHELEETEALARDVEERVAALQERLKRSQERDGEESRRALSRRRTDREDARAQAEAALHALQRCRVTRDALRDATARLEDIKTREADADRAFRAAEATSREAKRRVEQKRLAGARAALMSAKAAKANADAKRRALREAAPDAPDAEVLRDLETTLRALSVARAKTAVGVEARLELARAYRLTLVRDGKKTSLETESITTKADGELKIEIAGVGTLTIRGGQSESHAEAQNLEAQLNEFESRFPRDDEEDREAWARGLRARAQEAETFAARQETLRKELEHQEGVAALLSDHAREVELRAAQLKELGGAEDADLDATLAALEAEERDSALALKRMATTRTEAVVALAEASAIDAAARAAVEAARAAAGLTNQDTDLAVLLDRAKTDLAAREREVEASNAELDGDEGSEQDLARALDDAMAERDAVQQALSRARAIVAERSREEERDTQARALQAELDALDLADEEEVGSDEIDLDDIRAQLARAREDLDDRDAELRKTEGALSQVGGAMVREQHRAVRLALKDLEERERELEIDFRAQRLLLMTLQEVEQERGGHVGRAIGQPVSERFEQLTAGRYKNVVLADALTAEGISAAGATRDVNRFSVGTREQAATLIRLVIAEQLGAPLLLDDHLTQTDDTRLSWFRHALREFAERTQIIVITCRPEDYLFASDLPDDATFKDSAGGLVRAIDLEKTITRA